MERFALVGRVPVMELAHEPGLETRTKALVHLLLIVLVTIVVGVAVVGLRSIGEAGSAGAEVTVEPSVSSASASEAATDAADGTVTDNSENVTDQLGGESCSVIAGLMPADADRDGVVESCWPVVGAGDRPTECPSVGDYTFADTDDDDLIDACVRPDPLCPENDDDEAATPSRRSRMESNNDIGFEIDTDLDGDVDSCLRCPINGPVRLVDTDGDKIIDACSSREAVSPLRRVAPAVPGLDEAGPDAAPTVDPTVSPRSTATPRPRATATPQPRPTATPEPYASQPQN